MAEKDSKNKRKIQIRPLRAIFALLIILFFILSLLVYIVKVEDGSWQDEDDGVRDAAYSKMAQVRNTKSITPNADGTGYSYSSDLEEMVEEIVDKVNAEATNSDILERYLGKDKEKQKEFIAKLMRAEFATQFPDLRSRNYIGRNYFYSVITSLFSPTRFEPLTYKLQGRIKIKRASSDLEENEDLELLEYMPYDEFMELVDNNDPTVLH